MRKIKTDSFTYKDGVLCLEIPKEERGYFLKILSLAKREHFCFFLTVGQARPPRSVFQNYLLWGLLGDYAKWLEENFGEKVKDIDLYYEALSRYGHSEFYMIPTEAEKDLGGTAKFLERIDTQRIWNGQAFQSWVKMKAIYGSSEYDTEEMNRMMEGVMDEMEDLGISSSYLTYARGFLEEEEAGG